MSPKAKPPKLPDLLKAKIYKTGQTRGADDDVIFQNRVSRSSTVLIPYALWETASAPPAPDNEFESGFIVLISPEEYFSRENVDVVLAEQGLVLGENALVFYQKRADWVAHEPGALGWVPATARRPPLGGQYVARIAATTSRDGGERLIRGFDTTKPKGAGIRLYEYASKKTITQCRLQLEALYWLCVDADAIAVANGMTRHDARRRRRLIHVACAREGLLDHDGLRENRIINGAGHTICPLCLEELSGSGFFSRLTQAEGREVHDLTVTQINLFHIEEVRFGSYNHRPFNLGWGHHHCNVVVKDSGIKATLEWMATVLTRNHAHEL